MLLFGLNSTWKFKQTLLAMPNNEGFFFNIEGTWALSPEPVREPAFLAFCCSVRMWRAGLTLPTHVAQRLIRAQTSGCNLNLMIVLSWDLFPPFIGRLSFKHFNHWVSIEHSSYIFMDKTTCRASPNSGSQTPMCVQGRGEADPTQRQL